MMKRIVFIGSGAIATAIGDILATKNINEIKMLSIENDVIETVNNQHFNSNYFSNIRLSDNLMATSDKNILRNADIVFIAIPSSVVVDYIIDNKSYINPDSIIINLAKGFGKNGQLIPNCLAKVLPNPLLTLKGPSFAREIINRQETGLTAASHFDDTYNVINQLFEGTNIRTDFTDDVIGVEYASILKNIYAIVIGLVDANFDSANMRAIVITKAINEMRRLMVMFGGKEKTIFNYCGFGDFSLTALHDMSRNRTLGLLIGKGFFTSGISERVVLEGRIAVDVFYHKLQQNRINMDDYLLMMELYQVFNDQNYPTKKFVKRILIEN